MKPLPNINDTEAMNRIGKRSAMQSARMDAADALRDAYTLVQCAEWHELQRAAEAARSAAERLLTLAAMWQELDA